MAKVAETYREMVPVPKPAEMPSQLSDWPGGKMAEYVVTGHREPLIEARTWHWDAQGDPTAWPAPGTATETADAQDAPDASEAGEIETGDLVASTEAPHRYAEGVPSELPTATEVPVRQKRQYRKRQ